MAEGTKTATMTQMAAGPEDGLKEGQARVMFSVYDNFDSDGDRIKEGEFDAWVAGVKEAGDPIPVIFAHDHRNLHAYVGEITDLDARAVNKKGEKGLAGIVTFDLDDPDGAKAYKLAKGRRVTKWSYHWMGERLKAADAPGKYDLKGLSASEVSMVLRGANSHTDTLAVKSEQDDPFAGVKALLDEDALRAVKTADAAKIAEAIKTATATVPQRSMNALDALIAAEEAELAA